MGGSRLMSCTLIQPQRPEWASGASGVGPGLLKEKVRRVCERGGTQQEYQWGKTNEIGRGRSGCAGPWFLQWRKLLVRHLQRSSLRNDVSPTVWLVPAAPAFLPYF